jgi:UDP-GlcNAc3NAcA epimerase
LAGAIAAVKLHIPVAHVEAGLRSFNHAMPEEINRIVTDRVARWLFTPTDAASQNLRDEGTKSARITQVGDVMYDVALRNADRAKESGPLLDGLDVAAGKFVLATIHRAENTDDGERLRTVVGALARVAKRMPVVWPVHPRTRATMSESGLLRDIDTSIRLVEPVGYLDMVRLEMNAAVIATDSGGVQKEAFFYRTPCVTLRAETEWVELVDAGWNRVVAPDSAHNTSAAILAAIGSRGTDVQPYGAGNAAERIVECLRRDLSA